MGLYSIQLTNSLTKAGVELVVTSLEFSAEGATSFILKRRRKPDTAYTTIANIDFSNSLFGHPISIPSIDEELNLLFDGDDAENFNIVDGDLTYSGDNFYTIEDNSIFSEVNFHVLDNHVLSGNTYEYLLIPVIDDVQMLGVSAEIDYDMPFLHVADTSGELFAYMNISVTEQRNTAVGYVKPLWGKYPHAVRNSDTNYASGSAEALFIPFDSSCVPDISKATRSRNSALDMLTNGLQKVMRTPDGRGWTISVDGEPRVNKDEFFGADTVSFDWTEIGEFPATGVIAL